MDARSHFSGHSREYAEYRPSYPPALVDQLARLVPQSGTVWEAGCGSGQLSLPLASRFARVIATDVSAEQIAQAPAHPAIEYRLASAESSGLPDGTIDLSIAAQAAHWFDLAGYYGEVRRVSKPDAIVALITYGMTRIDDPIDRIVHRFYSETVGPYWSPERRHVEDGYRSLPFPFEEIEMPSLEMEAEWGPEELAGYVETWSATRALLRAEGPEKIAAFREALREAWSAGPAIRKVRWPVSSRVGRVKPTDADPITAGSQ